MTRKQMAFVCAIAGLTVFGAGLGTYAIERRFYNYCLPDPYGFTEQCSAQEWISFGIIVACWLGATYLVARREAIGPFACALMGTMVWLGILAFVVLVAAVDPSSYGAFAEASNGVRVGAIMAPLIGLLTAGVGYPMQSFIRACRLRRASA